MTDSQWIMNQAARAGHAARERYRLIDLWIEVAAAAAMLPSQDRAAAEELRRSLPAFYDAFRLSKGAGPQPENSRQANISKLCSFYRFGRKYENDAVRYLHKWRDGGFPHITTQMLPTELNRMVGPPWLGRCNLAALL
jgi:hypothetical protein